PQGPEGPQGIQGEAATITVGTTSTSAPGTDAQVTEGGTPSERGFNFTIPRGDKGDQGDVGPALNVIGNLDDPSDLPATGNPGDAYIIGGDLWVWSEDDSQWNNAGEFIPGLPSLSGNARRVLTVDNAEQNMFWGDTVVTDRIT